MKKGSLVLCAVLLVVVSIGAGLFLGMRELNEYNIEKNGVKTKATIIGYSDGGEDSVDMIDIEYVVDGRTYEGRIAGHGRVGNEVTVYYDPGNPKSVTDGTNIINVIVRFLPALIGPGIVIGFIVVAKAFGVKFSSIAK